MLPVRWRRQGIRPAAGSALRRISLVVLALVVALAPAARGDDDAQSCGRLIRIFDEIVQSRFDHRHLMIDRDALIDALRMRDQAEAACAADEFWQGGQAIRAALEIVGLVPPKDLEIAPLPSPPRPRFGPERS